jgi:hypothetical protein
LIDLGRRTLGEVEDSIMGRLQFPAHRGRRSIPGYPVLELAVGSLVIIEIIDDAIVMRQPFGDVVEENATSRFGNADYLPHPFFRPLKIFFFFKVVPIVRILFLEIEWRVSKTHVESIAGDIAKNLQAVVCPYFI